MSEDEITLVCHALVKARDGLLSERATGLPMLSQYRDDAFVLVEKALQTASHALAALAQPPAPTAQPAESTAGQPLRSICWANCPCRKAAQPVQRPPAETAAWQWSAGGKPPWNICDEATAKRQEQWPGVVVRPLYVSAQPVQQPTADGGMAYHMGRGAYECSVLPARGNQVKAFGELTSIQQAEWVAKAAVHAALSQPAQQPGAEPNAMPCICAFPPAGGCGSPCESAPAQRQPLTVPALTDAQMSECAWGYVADSRNLDAVVTGIIQATQLACAAAWGVTLAQKGEKL